MCLLTYGMLSITHDTPTRLLQAAKLIHWVRHGQASSFMGTSWGYINHQPSYSISTIIGDLMGT